MEKTLVRQSGSAPDLEYIPIVRFDPTETSVSGKDLPALGCILGWLSPENEVVIANVESAFTAFVGMGKRIGMSQISGSGSVTNIVIAKSEHERAIVWLRVSVMAHQSFSALLSTRTHQLQWPHGGKSAGYEIEIQGLQRSQKIILVAEKPRKDLFKKISIQIATAYLLRTQELSEGANSQLSKDLQSNVSEPVKTQALGSHSERITLQEVLGSLNGERFQDYQLLMTAACRVFNKVILRFPPGFTHLEMLEFGFREGAIHSREGIFVVDMTCFD